MEGSQNDTLNTADTGNRSQCSAAMSYTNNTNRQRGVGKVHRTDNDFLANPLTVCKFSLCLCSLSTFTGITLSINGFALLSTTWKGSLSDISTFTLHPATVVCLHAGKIPVTRQSRGMRSSSVLRPSFALRNRGKVWSQVPLGQNP